MATAGGAKIPVADVTPRVMGSSCSQWHAGIAEERQSCLCCCLVSSLVVLAVTIQRQGVVTLLQYCTPYETKDGFTVCCSFTIITLYSIITRTITITDTPSASCVCVCRGLLFVQLCACVYICVFEYQCSVLRACLLKGETGKSQ